MTLFLLLLYFLYFLKYLTEFTNIFPIESHYISLILSKQSFL